MKRFERLAAAEAQRLARRGIVVLVLTILAISVMPVASLAQDNPIPLTYRNLTVKAFEINNNRNDPMRGVKVTIEPEKPDQFVRFPKSGTINGALGTRFSKIPPSNVVGQYTIKVESRDCGEQEKKFRKNGASDQIVTFTFSKCGQSGVVANEFDRRAQGGYDVLVALRESGGTRGNGYWVHAYDKNNRQVTRIRTSGTGQANFRSLDPNGAPYRFDVKRGSIDVTSAKLAQLNRNERLDINLDKAQANSNASSPGGGKYDLRVQVETPLTVVVKDRRGREVAREKYDGSGVTMRDLEAGETYKVAFYMGRKKLAEYDYSMPGRDSTAKYRLDR